MFFGGSCGFGKSDGGSVCECSCNFGVGDYCVVVGGDCDGFGGDGGGSGGGCWWW